MKTKLAWFAIVTALAAVLAVAVFIHVDTTRLRRRLVEAQGRAARAEILRRSNREIETTLIHAGADEAQLAQALRSDVERLRTEVKALEQRARAGHAAAAERNAADATALANNRDPAMGLTRLEYFRDVGQASPAATVQSLIWAALKGDQAALNQWVSFEPAARAKADEIIASLPLADRETWTAEKIANLFFTGFFTEISAAELGETVLTDAQHAAVKLRVTNGAKTSTVPLELQHDAAGWRIVVTPRYIEAVRKRMALADRR